MASEQPLPVRQRRPSTSAPIIDIQGGVGPAGVSRPKHKRTFTGFGATEISNVQGKNESAICCLAYTGSGAVGAKRLTLAL